MGPDGIRCSGVENEGSYAGVVRRCEATDVTFTDPARPAQLVHRLIDARAPQAGQPHIHLYAPPRIQKKEFLKYQTSSVRTGEIFTEMRGDARTDTARHCLHREEEQIPLTVEIVT